VCDEEGSSSCLPVLPRYFPTVIARLKIFFVFAIFDYWFNSTKATAALCACNSKQLVGVYRHANTNESA
jgi:hypothetical protein